MIQLILITLIVAPIPCLLIFYYVAYRKKFRLGNKFPGPPQIPLIGNTQFWNRKEDDSIPMLFDLYENYGEFYRIWVGPQLAFICSNPKILEVILSSSTKYLKKSSMYDFIVPWLNEGLLMSSGSKWHSRRKILTPAFHFKILESFVEIFDHHSQILVQKLGESKTEDVINIYPYITLMALDVLCETAMGVELKSQTDGDCAYAKAVKEFTHIVAKRYSKIWLRIELLFRLVGLQKKQDSVLKVLHNFTESVIEARRKKLLDEMSSQTIIQSVDDEKTNKKMALLDILLQSTIDGKPLSNLDIREEVDTFMFQGHDTTTSGICFTLYLISQHKDVQDKLFEEIQQVIGKDKNKPVLYRDLQELKYMEMVIKESLRYYPSVPIIARKIEEEITLDDGRIIPADCNFTMNFFMMFRNKNYFPDPDKFIPERFSNENSIDSKLNPFTYIPFSAGSRNCIGQKFAMLELKSTISKILRNYELSPGGEAPIPLIELVLRSANGIQMKIKPRED